MFSIKRIFALCLMISLLCTFAGCGTANTDEGFQHPTLTINGEVFTYGMEIDISELESNFPDMTVENNVYHIAEGTRLFLREMEDSDKMLLVCYSISTGSTGDIDGLKPGDTADDFFAAYEGSVLAYEDAADKTPCFFVYDGEIHKPEEFGEDRDASGRPYSDEYNAFLAGVCYGCASCDGDIIKNITYGDYYALWQNK